MGGLLDSTFIEFELKKPAPSNDLKKFHQPNSAINPPPPLFTIRHGTAREYAIPISIIQHNHLDKNTVQYDKTY